MEWEAPDDDRQAMRRILEWLKFELDSSTDKRSWAAVVGLASGLTFEPRRIHFSRFPILVFEHSGDRQDVYTTLRDVVHVTVKGRYRPSLLRDAAAMKSADSEREPVGSDPVS
jgi:hypothetical protein